MELQLDYDQIKQMLEVLKIKTHKEWKNQPLYICSLKDLNRIFKERKKLELKKQKLPKDLIYIDPDGEFIDIYLNDSTLTIYPGHYKACRKFNKERLKNER